MGQSASTSSLEEAFRVSIESVQAISEEANRVETKIIGAFAVASAIVGISAAASTSLIGPKLYLPNALFYLAALAYLWVIFWTFMGLRLRTFYLPPDPRILREDYWHLPKDEFMQRVSEFAERHHNTHIEHLRAKSHSLLMVLPGLMIETASLLMWAFVRSAFPIS